MNTTCPVENFKYFPIGNDCPFGNESNTYYHRDDERVLIENSLCVKVDGKVDGCPHACIMYNHCISSQESNEFRPRRCDFLVDSRDGVKWSHIFLLIFGAVFWTSELISALDMTDMMAATLPEAETGGEPTLQRHRLQIRPEARNAIVVLFKFIFVIRTRLLPALSAAGAVVVDRARIEVLIVVD